MRSWAVLAVPHESVCFSSRSGLGGTFHSKHRVNICPGNLQVWTFQLQEGTGTNQIVEGKMFLRNYNIDKEDIGYLREKEVNLKLIRLTRNTYGQTWLLFSTVCKRRSRQLSQPGEEVVCNSYSLLLSSSIHTQVPQRDSNQQHQEIWNCVLQATESHKPLGAREQYDLCCILLKITWGGEEDLLNRECSGWGDGAGNSCGDPGRRSRAPGEAVRPEPAARVRREDRVPGELTKSEATCGVLG